MQTSYRRFEEANSQLQQCEQLASQIQSLQRQPGLAALGVDSPRSITARAEEASSRANIKPTSLVRIEPQSAVRLRDTDYRLRPTRFELRQVTLQQVLAFADAMRDEAMGTTVRDLRLTATDESMGTQRVSAPWTAELVLTQLIFAPAK